MSTPQELLFGVPINPAVEFENLYTQRIGNFESNLFPPNGINGPPDGTTDPQSSINYLMNKRHIIERSAHQRPMVRIADKDLNLIGELTGELSMDFEELMSDSGTANYVVHWSNWMVDYIVNLTMVEEDLHLIIDPYPDNRSWRNRWGGKIHTINIQRKEDGTSIVELQAVSNREHAKRLLYAANPFLLPEVQIPRMWILPGPTRSVCFLSGMANLARLFLPGMSFLTNLFDPLSWINPLMAANPVAAATSEAEMVNPLNWPIQIAFVNPVEDQSRWTVLGATWTTWHDATQDILQDSGTMLRVYTWLDEDEDSPHLELIDLTEVAIDLVGSIVEELIGINPELATTLQRDVAQVVRPGRNCVIFSYEDKSGQTGPTGTALDGLLNVIGVSLDDLISSTLINAETGLTLDGEPVYDLQGNEFPIVESILGVAPEPPKVIWREGQFSPQVSATHTMHKGSPKTVMTGGKSPQIVNQTQTFLIKWGLSQLQDVIQLAMGVSATATPDNYAWQTPLTPGLDELYQGQLDDILLAWQRITQPLDAIWGGELDFREYFERGSGTAYTLSSVITLQTALWKTRSYHGFKGDVQNGIPWTVDIDTGLGDRNGWELHGVIYVDQIHGIRRAVDRKSPLRTTLTIGDDKDKADPLARTIRALKGVYTLFGAFLGEGTIFA
jgi:hypothetical protein